MRLPPDAGPDSIADALDWIESQLGAVEPDLCDRVLLAAAEALANALEHGTGDVRFTVTRAAGDLTLAVRDAGPGPSATAIAEAQLPADPLQPGGRGLYLLRSLADSVSVDEGAVRLRFHLPTPDAAHVR